MSRLDAGPFAREAREVRREATALRVVRWRMRRLCFAIGEVTLALLLIVLVSPAALRETVLEVLCVTLALAGATPLLASAVQWGLVGLHYLRIPYRRLKPYYPRVSVIVPAWNEAAVIGATIEHLLDMEYPPGRLRVYVVDDASTDETGRIVARKAREHPGRVVHLRRDRGGEGKAHTLNHGIARALSDEWAQAVLIMDADVLFDKRALRKMTRHLSDPGVGAVTAYINEGTRDPNYLNHFVGFEYLTAQAGARRAQNIIGALACLAGGAQLHSRENLVALGGRIDTSSLAEDTVTTFTTQLLGQRVEFEGNALVWAEEPRDPAALWRQRLRWGRGNIQVSLQFASIWGRARTFRWRTLLPFSLIWFTVLLMPLLMFGSAAGLVGLYALNPPLAARTFTVFWICHAVVWVFGTAMAFAIDPAVARRAWLQGILFPGVISLLIILYTVHPGFFDVHIARLLAETGAPVGSRARAATTVFVYAWCFLSVPVAYLAKVVAERPRWRWLAPGILYVAGYGAFLAAVTASSYLKELFNADATWEKTVKVGLVGVPAGGGAPPA